MTAATEYRRPLQVLIMSAQFGSILYAARASGEHGHSTTLRLVAADPLLQAIAAVCRKAREDAGVKQVHIASQADVDQSTLARFERAAGWPRNPHNVGVIVTAYAEYLGRDARELLKEAVDAWGGESSASQQAAGRAVAIQAPRRAAQRRHGRPQADSEDPLEPGKQAEDQ